MALSFGLVETVGEPAAAFATVFARFDGPAGELPGSFLNASSSVRCRFAPTTVSVLVNTAVAGCELEVASEITSFLTAETAVSCTSLTETEMDDILRVERVE